VGAVNIKYSGDPRVDWVFLVKNLLILGIVILLSFTQTARAAQSNSVSFTYGFLYGSVDFPEEAHPTDNIVVNLTLGAYVDVTLYNFTLAISGLVVENWQTLHTEQLLSYSLSQGSNLTREIIVTLPQNTSERLNYVIEASTDKGYGRTSFYATYVRATTYDELSGLYNALSLNYSRLQADYAQLTADCDTLNQSYNSLKKEYDASQTGYETLNSSYEDLNASYNALLSNYKSLQDNYDYLKTKYDASTGELSIVRNLMFAFGVSTAILAATTIYFRKKAPYIVLRKETAVKPEGG
jgi:hypothetical protein